jgi:hypothetical protein
MDRAALTGFAPNCWLAPEFDPIQRIRELERQLNGGGGHIDQTHLYLDPLSAACWCALAEQDGYSAARAEMPLDRAAARIARATAGAPLDLIGLGAGDAREEVRLARLLLPLRPDLRLYLLDISQPLLSVAFQHAAGALADLRPGRVFAVQGDFHHLPRYAPLFRAQGRRPRRRVVCMFGNTFANLQSEILFVRNSLLAPAPDDLFLLNVPLACAPADQPDEILRRDPRLSGQMPRSLGQLQDRYDEWLTGPIRRYTRGARSVELSTHLDTAACPVPGSYAADVRATVRLGGGEERRFSLIYLKRYEVHQLVECMRQLLAEAEELAQPYLRRAGEAGGLELEVPKRRPRPSPWPDKGQ